MNDSPEREGELFFPEDLCIYGVQKEDRTAQGKQPRPTAQVIASHIHAAPVIISL